jgi:hypothetical protein
VLTGEIPIAFQIHGKRKSQQPSHQLRRENVPWQRQQTSRELNDLIIAAEVLK